MIKIITTSLLLLTPLFYSKANGLLEIADKRVNEVTARIFAIDDSNNIFPNCTGVLIGKRSVLSARHCALDSSRALIVIGKGEESEFLLSTSISTLEMPKRSQFLSDISSLAETEFYENTAKDLVIFNLVEASKYEPLKVLPIDSSAINYSDQTYPNPFVDSAQSISINYTPDELENLVLPIALKNPSLEYSAGDPMTFYLNQEVADKLEEGALTSFDKEELRLSIAGFPGRGELIREDSSLEGWSIQKNVSNFGACYFLQEPNFKTDGAFVTDCIVSPGNSGGPLFTTIKGELYLLGIASSIYPLSPDNIESFLGPNNLYSFYVNIHRPEIMQWIIFFTKN